MQWYPNGLIETEIGEMTFFNLNELKAAQFYKNLGIWVLQFLDMT